MSTWPSGWQRLFLFTLALLNLWISYVIFSMHRLMASANAAMAAVLLLLLITTWRRKGGR